MVVGKFRGGESTHSKHGLVTPTVCPKEFAHASLGNLEVLHQKADGSTIVFTHCEQENEIT